jgi:predicted transcriptional regulator
MKTMSEFDVNEAITKRMEALAKSIEVQTTNISEAQRLIDQYEELRDAYESEYDAWEEHVEEGRIRVNVVGQNAIISNVDFTNPFELKPVDPSKPMVLVGAQVRWTPTGVDLIKMEES